MLKKVAPLAVLIGLTVGVKTEAQQPTIPEILAERGKPVNRVYFVPSGIPPTVAEVLAKTDVIVRGIVGEPRSFLSDDQREVFTSYAILNPVLLYQPTVQVAPTPGPSAEKFTIIVRGGAVTIAGLRYSVTNQALPSVQAGTECLLFLKRESEGYRIAGDELGIFGITHGRLRPLTRKQGFATEYRDAPATEAAEKMTALRRSLQK